jgi:hypothetical protein
VPQRRFLAVGKNELLGMAVDQGPQEGVELSQEIASDLADV